MTLCTPPCLHQDYCAFYGCPFVREPQANNECPIARPLKGSTRRLLKNERGNYGIAALEFQSTANVLGVDSGKGLHTSAPQGERNVPSDDRWAGSASLTFIRECEHQVTDDSHHVRSAIVNSNLFGCVNTGPNLHLMTGRKASTKSGPQSGDWIVRGDVTAASDSRVTA